jgi:hypothetical protein
MASSALSLFKGIRIPPTVATKTVKLLKVGVVILRNMAN